MKPKRPVFCHPGVIPSALLLPGVALALLCITTGARGQTDFIALRAVRLDGAGGSARTAPIIHAQAHRTGSVFGLPLRADGAVWLDLRDPESSLVNIDELTLSREWDSASLRFGIGDVPWGISDIRSPIDLLTPRASALEFLGRAALGPAVGGAHPVRRRGHPGGRSPSVFPASAPRRVFLDHVVRALDRIGWLG